MRSDFINKRNLDRRRNQPPPTQTDGELIIIPSFDTFIWHQSAQGNDRWLASLGVNDQNGAKSCNQLPIGLLNPWNDQDDQSSGGLLPPPGGGPPTSTLAVRTPTRIVMGFDMTGVPTGANITEATLSLTVSSMENWVDTDGSRLFRREPYSMNIEVYKDGMFYRITPIKYEETEEEKQATFERNLEVYASGEPPVTDEDRGGIGGFPTEIFDPEIPGLLLWDDKTEVDGWSPEGWYLPGTKQQDNGIIHPNYPISPIVIPFDNEVPDIFGIRCPEYVLEDENGFGEVYKGSGNNADRWWFRDSAGRWWFLDDWIHDIKSRNPTDGFIHPSWIPYVPGLGVPIGGDGALRRWFSDETIQPFDPWFPSLKSPTDDYIDPSIGDDFISPARWDIDDPNWRTNPDLWWRNGRYPPPGFIVKPQNYPCPPTRTPPFIA